MSSSEESALLEHGGADVYDRFSKAQKNLIVSALSFAGLLPSTYELKYLTEMIHVLTFVYPVFVTGILVPSIPQIAHDLNSTGADVRYLSIPAAWNNWVPSTDLSLA